MKTKSIIADKLQKIIYYSAGFAGLRADDVLLSSFPRSGNTWVRFLLCNLISLNEWDGEYVDFSLLNRTMPELGANNLLVSWKWNTLPRVVKTHVRHIPLFGKKRAIGLVRDPRDVMVSYFHYAASRKGFFSGSFSEFIYSNKWGLPAWFAHYTSWREHWMLIIHYENLKRDPYHELERLLDFLNVELPPDTMQQAIERSSARKVRQMEKSIFENQVEEHFVRSTLINQWQDYFDEQNMAYFEELATTYDYRF